MKRCAGIITFILLLQAAAFAAEIRFQISLAKDRVRPGRQTTLSLALPKGVPPPEIPLKDSINYTYVNSSAASGEVMTIHSYRVMPSKAGRFEIGPISFSHSGDTYISNPVTIEVSTETDKQEAQPSRPGQAQSADFSRRIFATLNASKPEIFMNEQATMTVRLYTDWVDVEANTSQQPDINFAINGGFKLGQVTTTKVDGVNYAVVEWNQWFYVPEAGDYRVDPIKVTASISRRKKRDSDRGPINDNEQFYNDYLGRDESRQITVSTDALGLKVLQLPSAGRPKDFRGAVGSFILDAGIDRPKVGAGETLTLTAAITGKGNFRTVNMPMMAQSEGIKIYDPQVQKDDKKAEFRQLIKIMSGDVKELPKLSFSFFDPETREYVTLIKGPFSLEVSGEAKKKEPAAKKAPEQAAATIVYLKESPGAISKGADPHFYRTWPFIMIQLLPLVVLGAVILARKRMDLVMSDLPYARFLRASRKAADDLAKVRRSIAQGDVKASYGAIFKTMQDYFGHRLGVPPGGITETTISDLVEDKVVLEEVAGSIVKLFSDCYAARYASIEPRREDAEGALRTAEEIIDHLNKKKGI